MNALNPGTLGPSLLGVADPAKLFDPARLDARMLRVPHIEPRRHTLIIIVVSAIIFITVVALYELLRVGIQFCFVKSNQTGTIRAQQVATLKASGTFAGVTLCSALLFFRCYCSL